MAGSYAASGSVTPSYTSRPLYILHAPTSTRISIDVKTDNAVWTAAEVARDTFADWLVAEERTGALQGFDLVEDDPDNPDLATQDEFEKGLALSAYFLDQLASGPSVTDATNSVLLSTFAYFCSTYLAHTDVHSLAAGLPAAVRSLVIKAFYHGRTKLEIAGLGKHLPAVASGALLDRAGRADGDVQLYAVFGGQGMNEVYFDELQVSGERIVVRQD